MKKLFLLIVTAIASVTTNAQNISTIAGNGTLVYAGDNTPATATGFEKGVNGYSAIDKHGNVYFTSMYVVHKVDRKGIVTTIAGTGVAGFSGDGGPATAAQLDMVAGIAIDTADNVYLADHVNERIRKIDVNGVITTYAGGATVALPEDGDGAPATAATFMVVYCLLADKTGNLYFTSNHRIRKINAAGIVSRVVGKPISLGGGGSASGYGGPATAGELGGGLISQLAMNKAGDLFCVLGGRISKVSTTGILTMELMPLSIGDGGDGGPATAAAFNTIAGMCFDGADNMYLSCFNGGRIRRVDAVTGIVTTYAGTTEGYSGDGGPATAAQLQAPIKGLSMDCADNLYIPDGHYSTNRMRKVTRIHTPEYVSESNTLRVCMNSIANPAGTQLETKSAGTGERIDWIVTKAPLHGSMGGAPYSTTVGGSTMKPGLTYTPATGYVGADSFTVVVGPCEQVQDIRTIYVTVNPLPTVAAITGLNAICKGSVITLSNPTTGGVWSVVGTAAAVSSGTVTGITPGTANISYTVTDGECSSTATYAMKVGDCPAGVKPLAPKVGLSLFPNPARDVVHVNDVAEECTYRLMNMVGSVVLTGVLHEGDNTVDIKNVASGVYMLEVSFGGPFDVAQGDRKGLRVMKKIVKQ